MQLISLPDWVVLMDDVPRTLGRDYIVYAPAMQLKAVLAVVALHRKLVPSLFSTVLFLSVACGTCYKHFEVSFGPWNFQLGLTCLELHVNEVNQVVSCRYVRT